MDLRGKHMFVPFLVMLREGVEASLIVGIIASYMSKSNRTGWLPSLWIGVFLAIAVSLFVGACLQWLSAEFPQKQQELFEAIVGVVAVVVLSSMVIWMQKASRSISASLTQSLDSAFVAEKSQSYVLVALVFISVAREGLETIFFLLAIFQQSTGPSAPAGAGLGLAASVGVGILIYKGSLKLNLSRFFRITGVFIIFVAAGILGNAVRAFHEAGIWNHFQSVAFDISYLLPDDSAGGSLLAALFGFQDAPTVGALAVYLAYLAGALFCVFKSLKRVDEG